MPRKRTRARTATAAKDEEIEQFVDLLATNMLEAAQVLRAVLYSGALDAERVACLRLPVVASMLALTPHITDQRAEFERLGGLQPYLENLHQWQQFARDHPDQYAAIAGHYPPKGVQ